LRRASRFAIASTAIGLLASVAAPLATPSAGAVDADRATRQALLAAIPPAEAPGIDPVLDGLEVERTPALRRADAEIIEVARAQQEALLQWHGADQRRLDLTGRAGMASAAAAQADHALLMAQIDEARQAGVLAERRTREAMLLVPLEAARQDLRSLAAEALTSSSFGQYALLGSFDDFNENERLAANRNRGIEVSSDVLETARRPWARAQGSRRTQERTLARAQAVRAEAARTAEAAAEERDTYDRLLAELTRQANDARAAFDAARDRARGALVERRLARLAAQATDTNLPLVAIHAYWRASALAPCHVPWWLLAGVGEVESRHGTAQGSRLTPDGATTARILGIPLDGRPGVAAIADTDGGRLDGDATWDRAVGPMQFIPGTWARWASDGTADREADPHNLYDAALAAARYLCFGRGDLRTEEAQRAALLAYNRSIPYGTKVLAAGAKHRDRLDLPDVPEWPTGNDDAPDG
jgi:membrane-bound lytic murein transglycosylase B